MLYGFPICNYPITSPPVVRARARICMPCVGLIESQKPLFLIEEQHFLELIVYDQEVRSLSIVVVSTKLSGTNEGSLDQT
jgi:hypothetical protein